jgi:hypothetical protein
MAEEQPIGAEGMGFAFDNAEIASVQMSELSGTEMDETYTRPACECLIYDAATSAASYAWDYYQNTIAPNWTAASYGWPM